MINQDHLLHFFITKNKGSNNESKSFKVYKCGIYWISKKNKKRLMITNLTNFTNSYNQLKMKKI